MFISLHLVSLDFKCFLMQGRPPLHLAFFLMHDSKYNANVNKGKNTKGNKRKSTIYLFSHVNFLVYLFDINMLQVGTEYMG